MNNKGGNWVFNKDVDGEIVVPGIVRKVLAYCDEAMCVVNYFEEGAEYPVHSHTHTQLSYIAQGRFRFTIGDVEKEVVKGDTLCKQDGIKHGCVCLEKGVLVDFFTPMREDFVRPSFEH